jgi:hypothetical protein
MQNKRAIKCPRNAKRFTVVRIKGDTYSGRSMEDAMSAAMPDPGNRVEVFATCAKDAGEARMLWGPKQLIR